MPKPIVRDPIYSRRRFDAEIIELCVRWYITYRLSYRDLAAMMAELGAAAAFLASDDSSFMTASEVAVDGGLAQL